MYDLLMYSAASYFSCREELLKYIALHCLFFYLTDFEELNRQYNQFQEILILEFMYRITINSWYWKCERKKNYH